MSLDRLEPALVWERFGELTRIPRPSKQEDAAREYVLAWANARELEAATDTEGNVAVRVPSSPGRGAAPAVVLQAHLDMVCEREPWSEYDPREGRIHVVVEGDWVRAEETTLGADNGIGVAAAMAAADDPAIHHGPLELLFTVSEEQGLDGAKALDPSLVSGRLLVNLDGTSDESLTVGCAGSDHTFLRLPLGLHPIPADAVTLRIAVSGAKGGHSGEDIARGRANAIKVLGRVLSVAHAAAPFGLAEFTGGVSRNAIPREAHALIAVAVRDEDALRGAAEAALASVHHRYAGTDDGLTLAVDAADADSASSPDVSRAVLDLVAAIPTGVVALTPGLPGVIETSTSLTAARTTAGTVELGSMARSSNAAALDDLAATMASLARLSHAESEARRSYPPWEPRLDSPLLRTASSTFARLFGAEPGRTVVHGGLECAVLGQKLPGVEMISIGPEIVGPHAPGERLSISSTQRAYRLLGALLDDLSG